MVLSPFMGIGSEGYQAVKMGRKFLGIELKESYWKVACKRRAAKYGWTSENRRCAEDRWLANDRRFASVAALVALCSSRFACPWHERNN